MRLTLCGFGLTLIMAGAFSTQSAITAQEPAGQRASLAITGGNNFAQYCVACHGKDAKGTGTLAPNLRPKPADLTLLSKNNGGTFPRDMVFQVIDGRQKVKGHGGGDMPEWGPTFLAAVGPDNPDAVTHRINALVDYLETMQVK
ncbi:MAG: c-type cytochrome [Acidobacteriota bacterium]|nr:c-type cytochrome [Acidobacteriota bacterium]